MKNFIPEITLTCGMLISVIFLTPYIYAVLFFTERCFWCGGGAILLDSRNFGLAMQSIFFTEKNTIFHKPNTIFSESNTIFHKPNTIFPEPNTIFHEKSTIFHEKSISFHEKNISFSKKNIHKFINS